MMRVHRTHRFALIDVPTHLIQIRQESSSILDPLETQPLGKLKHFSVGLFASMVSNQVVNGQLGRQIAWKRVVLLT